MSSEKDKGRENDKKRKYGKQKEFTQ